MRTNLDAPDECEHAARIAQSPNVNDPASVTSSEAKVLSETEQGTTSDIDRLSDSDLAERALLAIRQALNAGAKNVRATVRAGWLILEGEVETLQHKRAAAEAGRHVGQVRGISNNIALENDVLARRVSENIDQTFAARAQLQARRIMVTAYDHKIILCGYARSLVESEDAEVAAWQVPGVACVVNRIRPTG